jgi:hypothetical protein
MQRIIQVNTFYFIMRTMSSVFSNLYNPNVECFIFSLNLFIPQLFKLCFFLVGYCETPRLVQIPRGIIASVNLFLNRPKLLWSLLWILAMIKVQNGKGVHYYYNIFIKSVLIKIGYISLWNSYYIKIGRVSQRKCILHHKVRRFSLRKRS